MSRRWIAAMMFARWDLTPHRLRIAIMRFAGMEIHPTAQVRSGTRFMGGHLSLGAGVLVNHDCFFENEQAKVTLGAGCGVAPGASFLTASHMMGPRERRWGTDIKGAITVGDGVWIGAGAIVLAGVSIGSGCVIAAGAVVTSNCQPDGVYAGVPARRVKDLP